VAVDLYRHPNLRRRVVRLLSAEMRLKSALRSLRHASAWDVALIAFILCTVLVHSWTAVALLSVLAVLKVAMWHAEQRHYAQSEIGETDSLSGEQFEEWLGEFFAKLGFEVERTRYRRDFGADFILTWNGVTTAVQAKSGHTRVGVNAVQQVVAAKAFYGCGRAMVVTNQYFTEQAVVLAQANGVVLRSRDDLMRKILSLKHLEVPVEPESSPRGGRLSSSASA
jgi:HJR/Mrr/RecB family endonuclease